MMPPGVDDRYRWWFVCDDGRILQTWLQMWKDWFDTDAPEESLIPDDYSKSLSTFHKMLLIRSWCPDRTVPMAKIYVAQTMGRQVRAVIF